MRLYTRVIEKENHMFKIGPDKAIIKTLKQQNTLDPIDLNMISKGRHALTKSNVEMIKLNVYN